MVIGTTQVKVEFLCGGVMAGLMWPTALSNWRRSVARPSSATKGRTWAQCVRWMVYAPHCCRPSSARFPAIQRRVRISGDPWKASEGVDRTWAQAFGTVAFAFSSAA